MAQRCQLRHKSDVVVWCEVLSMPICHYRGTLLELRIQNLTRHHVPTLYVTASLKSADSSSPHNTCCKHRGLLQVTSCHRRELAHRCPAASCKLGFSGLGLIRRKGERLRLSSRNQAVPKTSIALQRHHCKAKTITITAIYSDTCLKREWDNEIQNYYDLDVICMHSPVLPLTPARCLQAPVSVSGGDPNNPLESESVSRAFLLGESWALSKYTHKPYNIQPI